MNTNTYPFPKAAHDVEGVFYIPRKKATSKRFSFKKIPLPSLPEEKPLNKSKFNDHIEQKGNGRVYMNIRAGKTISKKKSRKKNFRFITGCSCTI